MKILKNFWLKLTKKSQFPKGMAEELRRLGKKKREK